MGLLDWMILLLLAAAAVGAGCALHKRKGADCDGNCACCSHCRHEK